MTHDTCGFKTMAEPCGKREVPVAFGFHVVSDDVCAAGFERLCRRKLERDSVAVDRSTCFGSMARRFPDNPFHWPCRRPGRRLPVSAAFAPSLPSRPLTSSLQLTAHRWLRKLEFVWHHGALAARITACAFIVATCALAVASWQAVRADRQADRLSARLAKLQSVRADSASATQAAEPPDVIRALPSAPGVAQVVQTLQQAADKEGAQVMSLQAEDHAPTAIALGHLDLVLSIKATFPSILTVIQQVLERYPGATLRQIQVTHVVSSVSVVPAAAVPMMGASAPQATSAAEAHVTLAFWRRPLDVEFVPPSALQLPASAVVVSGTTASASFAAAAQLPPLAGPSNGSK